MPASSPRRPSELMQCRHDSRFLMSWLLLR